MSLHRDTSHSPWQPNSVCECDPTYPYHSLTSLHRMLRTGEGPTACGAAVALGSDGFCPAPVCEFARRQIAFAKQCADPARPWSPSRSWRLDVTVACPCQDL